MRAVTTSIVHEDPFLAGREAATELLAQMGKAMDLVLVFVTSRHPPEKVVEGLFSRLPPHVALAGCSSAAEINADEALSGSVTAMGLALGEVSFEVITLESIAESTDAGRELADRALAFGASLIIVFADIPSVNCPKLMRGMRERLGRSCAVIGGVASDQFEFERTFQLSGTKVVKGIVAVALKGPIAVTTAAKAGFQPLGAPRTCTRVEGDGLVLELDGVPALDLYREFLGEEVMSRPRIGLEYPLAVVAGAGADYMNSDERSQMIRVVRSLDYERKGFLCADIQEGAKVRLTRATKDDLIDAAALSVEEARRDMPSPALALVFDCVGRRLVLGARLDEEIKAVRDKLGESVPMMGFYTFGELSPVEGEPAYHAQTFTIALIGSPPHAL